jgi:hypothetical protein
LTDIDPFADVVADDAAVFDAPAPEAPKKTPAKKAAPRPESSGEGKLTVTFKGGAGFDAPWIVLHAADISDAYEQLSGDYAALLVELMGKVKKAGAFFSGGEAKTAARSAPQQAQDAPADAPDCPPGWTYRSGVGKTGKPYKGFFPPRGDDTKPIFF